MANRRHVDVEPVQANALTTNLLKVFYGAAIVDNGSAVQLRFRHGAVGGAVIKPLKLAANQGYDGGPYEVAGIPTPNGVYTQIVAGTLGAGDAVIYGEYT
jgi:hypothetical protein